MIDVREMTPLQLQQTGLAILSRELGPAGLVRFLQQFEMGSGDYTAEREQWLANMDVDSIVQLVTERRQPIQP
jgi:hypothetical protein